MTDILTANTLNGDLSGTPLFFRLICRLFDNIQFGTVKFILPDERVLTFSGAQSSEIQGTIVVHDYAFAWRTVFGGDCGFFESYADGQWDTPNLATTLFVFAKNVQTIQKAFHAFPAIEFVNNIRHSLNKNTRSGSKRNIVAHYDLGNEFYEKWLDDTMTYSSAFFGGTNAPLNQAQTKKYKSLADKIDLKPGEDVLEIGSGWGGFAEYAAKTVGANVVGITLSPSQYEYACKRIFNEGLSERVTFRLQDYRDVNETYDKIASIEMFEAVGQQYWQTYFDKVRHALKPGGTAGLQIITIDDDLYGDYMRSTDFIQRYVFPGGALPSPTILRQTINKAGLGLQSVTEFGQDYAQTLHQWHERFLSAWDDIKGQGFDDRFKKLWRFYLAYCEAGFRAGTTNVCQIAVNRP